MSFKDIARHAREFARHIRNHQWERHDAGHIVLPKARALIRGSYSLYSNDGERPESAHNLVTIQGLNYLLETALRGGPAQTQFYIALFGGAYTPQDDLTAADFAATAQEFVSPAEGYTEATRPIWQPGASASGALDSSASMAGFTIASANMLTIRGAALLSDQTKGGTGGVLISVARFANDRQEADGNTLKVSYSVSIVSP